MLSYFWPPHLPKIHDKIQCATRALEPIKNYIESNSAYNEDLQFSDNALQAVMLRSKLEFYHMILQTKQVELSEEVEAKISVYEKQLEHIYLGGSQHSFKTLRALEDMRKQTVCPSKIFCIGRAIHICNQKISIDKHVAALMFEDIACLIGVGNRERYALLLERCKKQELQQYANVSLQCTKDNFYIGYKLRDTLPSDEIIELLLSIDQRYLSASEEDQQRLVDLYAKKINQSYTNSFSS